MKSKDTENRWSHYRKTFNGLLSSLFVIALLAGQPPGLYAEDARIDRSATVIVTVKAEFFRDGAAPEELVGLAANAGILNTVGTVEPNEGKTPKRNVHLIAPSIADDTIDLVGPSGEAIHAVLYPGIELRKLGTPAN